LGWRCLRRQPQAGFGILLFFLALAPVSNVIPINTVLNERYLSLPLLGPLPGDLVKLIKPASMTIEAEYKERGGIKTKAVTKYEEEGA
jgi:hypothetical protein